MIPVKPNTKTTLVLSAAFSALGFMTARSVIRKTILGDVRGVDSNGNIYDWTAWNERLDFEDSQPSLRSSLLEFPIPTLVVIPGFFGNFSAAKRKFKRTSSLRQIFNLYSGICQYCRKDIQYSHATKDHALPKSKGGSNHDSNIVLACKKCNNKKASKFPFPDITGKEVKPIVLTEVQFLVKADNIQMRPEWEQFYPINNYIK